MFQEYKTYLQNFMIDFDFPKEAQMELNDSYEKVFSDITTFQTFTNILEMYSANKNKGFPELLRFCKQVSANTNVHEYAVYVITLIIMTKIAKAHYQAAQIPSSIWENNFLDLRYKLDECKLVKGIWGTFVPDWFLRFFDVSRFAFGILQFEIIDFGCIYNKNDLTLNEKSSVINVHIPRTGTGLTPQDVDYACENAAQFFKDHYAIEPIFVCHSWLLYPENKKLLKPSSNLYSFISRFDIVKVEEYPNYKEVWRLFDCDYTGDVSLLPADTSLRRAYIDRIKNSEKTGCAYGVFAYKSKKE